MRRGDENAERTALIIDAMYEGKSMDFQWLMTNLLAVSDKFQGCKVIFPDTVFFKKGKPEIIIKSNPRDEYALIGTRQPKKLSLQSIYKDFQNVVRRRKKDYVGPFGRLYFKSRRNRSNSPTDAKSGSVTRFISSKDLNQEAVRNDSNARGGANGAAADMSGTGFTLKEMTAEANAVPGERSVYYKDVALIRESLTET